MEYSLSVAEKNDFDISQISEIEKECFTTPWTKTQIASFFDNKNNSVYVIRTKNYSVIAYCEISFILDEAYISNIAVKKDYRQIGVGGILLKGIIDISKEKGISFISLEVRESNTSALALYNKYGFVQNGVLKNHYTNPKEDACIMTLFLIEANNRENTGF